MRTTTRLMIGAACLIGATPAAAATFVFSGGNYVPGTTAPEPLLSPDVLNMTTGSNKIFNGVTFTNQSGIVNWSAGTVFLGNSAAINNQSLWNMTSDDQLVNLGGATSTFTNTGVFRKSSGVGATNIGTIAFVNSGTIDAQTGRIVFGGGNATFNAGSIFTGAGQVDIGTATFNGGFTSSNVDFTGGTFTGNAAALTGTADWEAGTFSGTWAVNGGATLTATTGSNKLLSGANLTNNGTIDWQAGTIFMGSASQLVNNGTITATSDEQLVNLGGATSTFTNDGVFRKSIGSGTTTIGTIAFINNGTIDAQTGKISFGGGLSTFNAGSIFTGAGQIDIGTSTFNGGFTSSNVDFEGGTFTGNAAALTGAADWVAGTFTGSWVINSGSTLGAVTASNKTLNAANFINDGAINWQGGTVFLGNASQLVNNGTVTATSDDQLVNLGGATSTFTNDGIFRKSTGTGTTTIGTIAFVNNGTIDAQTGIISFGGGNAAFNHGSIFTGAGQIDIGTSTFNGGFTSSNVDFQGGTFTGNAAALTGAAEWMGGTFTGTWTINSGSTLTALTASNKILSSADLTNKGTFNWQGGTLFAGSGTQLVNNGTITATGDDQLVNLGGAASSVVNNGLIEKTGSSGVTSFNSTVPFDNNGTINVLSGTIALPTAFTNDGTLGGTGTFTSTNLTNGGIITPGATGATGTLALTGNYTQTAFGSLNTQLASTGSFDLFNISGTAALNGTLALSCILSCTINTGDSFVILNSVGSLLGTFSNVTTSGFLSGFTYNVIYDYAADLVRLDVINAGTVITPGAVPEPTTWMMMLFGFGLIGSTLRRRNATSVAATV